MVRIVGVLACLISSLSACAADKKTAANPSFDYAIAQAHELKPHRRTIPFDGITPGFNQLRLTLKVSPTGEVVDAEATGDAKSLGAWPQLRGEAVAWKFLPFEKDGKPVAADVEEYIDLVPPERLPQKHVVPPVIRSNSKIQITLERSGCFGTCPSYKVSVTTDGIVFDGRGFVVAVGQHKSAVNAEEVRNLAAKFISSDFYSMDESYQASVTDNPTFVLAIDIDGRGKQILDYVGAWEGMPAVVTELEDEIDKMAGTNRWVKGTDGLVDTLKAEKFDFHTFAAQTMLKETAARGETATVSDLLEAGVPLTPLPAPVPKEQYAMNPFEKVGWLSAAGVQPEALQIFIVVDASKNDQNDKDLALIKAARAGHVESVEALITYGANPNVDLNKLVITERGGSRVGSGSILIESARSGNPDMVRDILRYSPSLEARDREGKTAIFAAGEYGSDQDARRAECVKLLAEAGADVNARDDNGNTPLHETFLTDVQEELLKLGANVNARNKDGETPIFTTVDDTAIPLFVKHGADLTIRNNKGETVMEAAKDKGPLRQEALRRAIEESTRR